VNGKRILFLNESNIGNTRRPVFTCVYKYRNVCTRIKRCALWMDGRQAYSRWRKINIRWQEF